MRKSLARDVSTLPERERLMRKTEEWASQMRVVAHALADLGEGIRDVWELCCTAADGVCAWRAYGQPIRLTCLEYATLDEKVWSGYPRPRCMRISDVPPSVRYFGQVMSTNEGPRK